VEVLPLDFSTSIEYLIASAATRSLQTEWANIRIKLSHATALVAILRRPPVPMHGSGHFNAPNRERGPSILSEVPESTSAEDLETAFLEGYLAEQSSSVYRIPYGVSIIWDIFGKQHVVAFHIDCCSLWRTESLLACSGATRASTGFDTTASTTPSSHRDSMVARLI
jgi:hypothetical protein